MLAFERGDAHRAQGDLADRSGRPLQPLSANSVAGYAYSDNYLIDLKHAVDQVDVEATTTIRQGRSRRGRNSNARPHD